MSGGGIRLRPAQPLDAGRVGAILSGWIDETGWMPRVHSRAEDIAHAAEMVARGWVTVAEGGRDLAGDRPGLAGFMARDETRIHALYVAAQARGAGLGAALLEAAKRSCDRLDLWTFQNNLGARRFYERHGFRELERTEGAGNDENLPDIRYRWQRSAHE